jgi:hypothetical protein
MCKKMVFLLFIFMSAGISTIARAQDDYGFRFVRVIYDDVYGRTGRGFSDMSGFSRGGRGGGGRYGSWATDYPTADLNLHEAISRTTNIPLMGDPLALSFSDPEIFLYPVLMITEPGYWLTNSDEVERMQKYFARGGFMIIDDFHDFGGKGPQWNNMYNNIKQVFPDREPVLLKKNDPIWSIYYDIDPSIAPSTKPGFTAEDCQYYGIYDDKGRMMVFISYNQDIGDGWEWPGRLDIASTISFQMAINIIMYALTH